MRSWIEWLLLAVSAAVVGVLTISLIVGLRGGAEPAAGRTDAPDPSLDGERTRVEVLNGAGEAGLARRATDRLRDQGFDVVYFGNADSFGWDSSVVLDRIGVAGRAGGVAEALGIARIRTDLDSTLYLDATVVLGRDWAPPQRVPAAGAQRLVERIWRWIAGGPGSAR